MLSALMIFTGASAAQKANCQTSETFRLPSFIKNTHKPVRNPGERVIPEEELSLQLRSKKISAGTGDFITPSTMHRATRADKKEKLDSVCRNLTDGTKVSLQAFEYTQLGQPLRASNYTYDRNGVRTLYSVYEYTYDAKGRMIRSDNINKINSNQDQRYEYFYNDDSDRYSRIIYSAVNQETMILEPLQKAEYEYDQWGNVTKETLYVSYDGGNSWKYFDMHEASWLENGLQTSYYTYKPNENRDKWLGEKGERFIYNPDGSDKEKYTALWENDAWLEYIHDTYIYREDGQMERHDTYFWNREKQDWSGYDFYVYDTERNYYTLNKYDDKNRISEILMYKHSKTETGIFVLTQRETYTYEPLENGETSIEHKVYLCWEGPTPTLYAKDIARHNSFDRETYFKSFNYGSGYEKATDEVVRHIDKNNIYRLGYIYAFTSDKSNTRYGLTKTEYKYASENPAVFHPIQSRNWKGSKNSDSEWTPYTRAEFTWDDDMEDVYTKCINYAYDDTGHEYLNNGFQNVYDLTMDIKDIVMWSIPSKRPEFYLYKTISQTNWYNKDHNDEWDASSCIDSFHYSAFETNGIDSVRNSEDATETERFDITGRRLMVPMPGINIIHYSNGTVRKVMVAE